MKTLILAAAGALALGSAAQAQTVIKEREQGVYSAPVAGATPQAREYPAPDTTVGVQRETTTVVPESRTRVIEEQPSSGSVVIERR